MNNLKIKDMTYIALVAAVMCVIAPITIPLPFTPIPISMATFVVYITTIIIGKKRAVISILIYLLIGAVGVPVFSGYSGGVQKIASPTGGYLIGYIFCAFVIGWFVEKFENKMYMYAVGVAVGTLTCYTVGTVWLSYQAQLTFTEALIMGVIPYIPLDVLKMIIAVAVGYPLKKQMKALVNA